MSSRIQCAPRILGYQCKNTKCGIVLEMFSVEAETGAMSVEFYGVERYVTGGMHVLSVRPELARVDNDAAVDVSDRRN